MKDGPLLENPGKFYVARNDGSSDIGKKHRDCDYFVLDVTHDPYAIPAIKAYVDACQETHPQLAAEMRRKYL